MKPVLLFFTFIACALFCFSQKSKKDELFLFDKQGKNITDFKKTSYFIRVRYVNDTSWKIDTYWNAGPMQMSETCKDSKGQTRHGQYAAYRKSGYLDSAGKYVNGQMADDWDYYNDTGRIVMQKTFDNGALIKTRDILKEQEEKDDNEEENEDNVFVKVEKESEFKGGIKQWSAYLTKNLRYPEVAIQTNTAGMGVVSFIVGTDGSVNDIFLFKSLEYSLDDESVRMIKESPKWEPAHQNGKKVKSYKRQPIVFSLTR